MKKLIYLLSIAFLIGIAGCKEKKEETHQVSIIPQPHDISVQAGEFEIISTTKIWINLPQLEELAGILAQHLGHLCTFDITVSHEESLKSIKLEIDSNQIQFGKDGYSLIVNEHEIKLVAAEEEGVFHGIQSLLQLIQTEEDEHFIPCVTINDLSRFSYRGMHLDVCRHMFPVDFIKKYIDLMAYYKFNTFHWHLTEDQGWRIEIKKYPKLQEIAAYRDSTLIGHYSDQPHQYDSKKYGGYYTQEEIKEIVHYASDRYITIIPEIELPGHSLAALSAYPEFACTDGPFNAATKWGVFPDIYCSKEETINFLKDVLSEVMELFPGKYIHIGGDEAPKDKWKECIDCQSIIKREGLKDEHELQSYFIETIEIFLNENGRQLIGWDEILEGGLSPNATVMSWRGIDGGIAAAKMGHDAIMTPGTHCYFDHYQANPEFQPTAIGGMTTLKEVYHYEPIPEDLNDEEAKHILGAQANVWTEYIPTTQQVEYMILPRMAALAEVNWTDPAHKDWGDFQKRIQSHYQYYEQQGLNYCKGSYYSKVIWEIKGDSALVQLESEILDADIRYELNEGVLNKESKKYQDPFMIPTGTTINTAVLENGELMEKPTIVEINKQ